MIPQYFDILTLEPQHLLTPLERPYVEITAGCLMPNHYHLMATPLSEHGISTLLHKVGTSYTKYFDIKYKRTGRLFESTFKAKHIDRHEYAFYLTQYIHLNPVDLFQGITDEEEKMRRIRIYPWSSLPDYLGAKSRFSLLLSSSFRESVVDLDATRYGELLKEMYLVREKTTQEA